MDHKEKNDNIPAGYIPYVVFEATVTRYERYLKYATITSIGLGILLAATAVASWFV